MNEDIFDEEATNLRIRLQELRTEHQDLDEAIARLSLVPVADELIVRRFKKRKLLLKDRLVAIERLLDPNELA